MRVPQQGDYDAFISYRRQDGSGLARWIRSKLRRFRLPEKVAAELSEDKKKLYTQRPNIWLDTAYERPSDDFLTNKVYPALDRSARLIVISTPSVFLPLRAKDGATDEPNWLTREIDHFLGGHPIDASPKAIDLVLGPGGADDRFPGRLADKPRWDWIDLRRFSWWRSWGFSEELDAGVAKLVAGLYDIPDALLPELRREERRRRNVLLIGIGLVAVLVALIIAALGAYAWQQRNEARAEAERTRRQFYLVSMNLAQSALNEGSVPLARQLLEAQRPREQQEDFRDIDWTYLYQRTTLEKAQYYQKDVAFESVAISHDGALVAAGGRLWGVEKKGANPSHLVYVWAQKEGKLRHALQGHENSIAALAFSPTDPLLASIDGRQLIVWSLESGQARHSFPIFAASALAYSPDGSLLAVVNGAQVDLFETRTWTRRGKLSAYPDQNLRAPVFSPDGRLLAAGGAGGKLAVWDIATSTGRPLFSLAAHESHVLSAAWSADSGLLATGSVDGAAVWDMNTKKQVADIALGDGANSLAFAPGGKLLAIGLGSPWQTDSGGKILLWDVPTRTVRGTLKGHLRRIESLAFLPSGQELVSAGEEEAVRVWDLSKAGYHAALARGQAPVWSLAFSPDGSTLAAGDGDGAIRVLPIEPGKALGLTLRGHDRRVVDLSFDSTGHSIASASWDGSVRLWNTASPASSTILFRSGEVQQASQLLTALRFSPDGTTLAVATCGGQVLLWKAPAFERRRDLQYGGCLGFLAWSPDGKYIVAGGGDPANEDTPLTVTVRSIDGSAADRVLSGHGSWPTSAAFSPDGKRLATASWNGEIIFWNWPGGTLERTILGHLDIVTAIAFTPSGRSVVSASRDKTVRFWDTETGQGRTVLREREAALFSMAVHSQRGMVAAGDADGTVALWSMEEAASPADAPRR
jgi:WD40 repeat protein